MINVEFTSNYSSHKRGDVVALETSKAKRYISLSLAKFHSEYEPKPKAKLEPLVEVEGKESETVIENKPNSKKTKLN